MLFVVVHSQKPTQVLHIYTGTNKSKYKQQVKPFLV